MSASTTGTNFRQDMPPEGGYKGFNWHRTYAKTWVKPGRLIFGFYAWAAVSIPLAIEGRRRQHAMNMLELDTRSALSPFLYAEQDRKKLKVWKKNREMEVEVMKDVRGWKAGTWWGEPVYYTIGDQWWDPNHVESWVHSSYMRAEEQMLWRERQMYEANLWYHKYYPKWILDLPQA